jgi:hypothetical protein
MVAAALGQFSIRQSRNWGLPPNQWRDVSQTWASALGENFAVPAYRYWM